MDGRFYGTPIVEGDVRPLSSGPGGVSRALDAAAGVMDGRCQPCPQMAAHTCRYCCFLLGRRLGGWQVTQIDRRWETQCCWMLGCRKLVQCEGSGERGNERRGGPTDGPTDRLTDQPAGVGMDRGIARRCGRMYLNANCLLMNVFANVLCWFVQISSPIYRFYGRPSVEAVHYSPAPGGLARAVDAADGVMDGRFYGQPIVEAGSPMYASAYLAPKPRPKKKSSAKKPKKKKQGAFQFDATMDEVWECIVSPLCPPAPAEIYRPHSAHPHTAHIFPSHTPHTVRTLPTQCPQTPRTLCPHTAQCPHKLQVRSQPDSE